MEGWEGEALHNARISFQFRGFINAWVRADEACAGKACILFQFNHFLKIYKIKSDGIAPDIHG